MYNSRGQSPRLLGEKYGRFGHTCGGFEYHFAICASSSLSQISLSENQSSNNAIKSPSICVVKFFVNLSSPFRFRYPRATTIRLFPSISLSLAYSPNKSTSQKSYMYAASLGSSKYPK